MKPKFKEINQEFWSLGTVKRLASRMSVGEQVETGVLTSDLRGLANLKSNLVKIFGPGAFSTTTIDSDGSKLEHVWIRRN